MRKGQIEGEWLKNENDWGKMEGTSVAKVSKYCLLCFIFSTLKIVLLFRPKWWKQSIMNCTKVCHLGFEYWHASIIHSNRWYPIKLLYHHDTTIWMLAGLMLLRVPGEVSNYRSSCICWIYELISESLRLQEKPSYSYDAS